MPARGRTSRRGSGAAALAASNGASRAVAKGMKTKPQQASPTQRCRRPRSIPVANAEAAAGGRPSPHPQSASAAAPAGDLAGQPSAGTGRRAGRPRATLIFRETHAPGQFGERCVNPGDPRDVEFMRAARVRRQTPDE
jgi:hypothetical protein